MLELEDLQQEKLSGGDGDKTNKLNPYSTQLWNQSGGKHQQAAEPPSNPQYLNVLRTISPRFESWGIILVGWW